MTDDSRFDDARAVWQSQAATSLDLPTPAMRTRIGKIDALMGRAKFATILGATLAFPMIGWMLYTFPRSLERIGGLVCIIAVALQMHQVWSLVVDAREATVAMNILPSVVAYRAALERQRRFFGGAGAWSRLITFCAGPLIFLVGSAQIGGWDTEMKLTAALCVALPLGVFANSRGQAKRYQTEIAELDRLQSEKP